MSKEWYLISNSNYLSGYENEEFSSNSVSAFNELLNNAPEAYSVILNNTKTIKVIVQSKSNDATHKKLLTSINEVVLGDLIKYKNNDWLVVDFVDDNKMYSKTSIKLCNDTFPIKYNKTRVLLTDENGELILDQFGRSQYTERYEIEKDEPCVVETKGINTLYDTNQFQLPNGEIQITLKYQPSDTIQLNYVFDMFNDSYKIIDIDYTKVINKVGIVTIRAKREQEG